MSVRIIANDVGFTEGPVITQTGDVIFTSIDHGRLYQAVEGKAQLLAETGSGPNGARAGRDGCIYVAQNGGAWPAHRWPHMTGGIQVVRTGGRVEYVTQDPISPNDLCFGPDGLLYVTDPTRRRTRDDGRIWRCDVTTGEAELLTSTQWYPNGIAFGHEADAIYLADTGNARVVRYPIQQSGKLGAAEVFAKMRDGSPDGLAFDTEGHLVVAVPNLDVGHGTVQTYDRDGKLLDVFDPGHNAQYTNIALSSANVLYVTANTGIVLAVDNWPHAGLTLHPFR